MVEHYPKELVDTCLNLFNRRFSTILETNVYDSSWGKASKARWPDSVFVGFGDGQKSVYNDYYYRGSVLKSKDKRPFFELIISNPPKGQELAVFSKCFTFMTNNSWMLSILPLSFLESKKRSQFFRDTPLYQLHVLSTRPNFVGKRQPRSPYGVFIWRKDLLGFFEGDRIFSLDWR